jgi:hypothetical protein
MVLTSELAHVTSTVLCMGILFPHKIKFNPKELKKFFFFLIGQQLKVDPLLLPYQLLERDMFEVSP